MARHMNYLRKHQKVILAVMGVVCMITFVVGPYLLDLVASGGGGNERDKTVVSWKGGEITESKLHTMRNVHVVAVNFLRDVIATAVERGGQPIVNGRPITEQDLQMLQDPGIPGDASEFSTIRTMLLAEKAREHGIHVDQESVRKFLFELAPEVQESEWQGIALRNTPAEMPMSLGQLLDQIAYELKAQQMRMLAQAGLFAVSPGQVWDYHQRLNRRFSIEAYPVDVAALASQVGGTPSHAELTAIFEKGKNRNPDPASAEPGFRRPHRVAFEYLKVDFNKPFLEEAKKQITDKQVAERYEQDVAQGKHKVLELPPDPTKPPESPPAPAGDKPPETTPDETKPNDTKPAEDKPAEDKPAEDKPAEEKPESPEGSCQDEPAEKAEDKPAETPAEKPADDKPAEATPTGKPGEAKPAEAAAAPPPKFKPLEEVADEIRTALAQPIAQEKRDAAVKQAISEVNEYGRKHIRWQGVKEGQVKSSKITDPGPLNLEGLARKYQFQSGSTKLVDIHEIRDYELGQKVMEFDVRSGRFTPLTFADIAFGRSDPLYSPQEANSMEPDISYIYWRTAEEEPADVTFDQVRDQVVEAWKMKKAFGLAQDEARKLAEKARSAASLKEVVDPTKVVTTLPFSWLSTGSLAFGFGEPSLSTIPGIDLAGHDFMEGVFSLHPGETGIAPDQPHKKVYVVRVLTQEPADDVLREQFLESGLNFQVMNVAQREMFRTSLAWYEELEKEMRLVWERPPIDESRN